MKLIKIVLSFIDSIRTAGHAANLARNGKIKESQAIYRS
jgi:hypothetical protein